MFHWRTQYSASVIVSFEFDFMLWQKCVQFHHLLMTHHKPVVNFSRVLTKPKIQFLISSILQLQSSLVLRPVWDYSGMHADWFFHSRDILLTHFVVDFFVVINRYLQDQTTGSKFVCGYILWNESGVCLSVCLSRASSDLTQEWKGLGIPELAWW